MMRCSVSCDALQRLTKMQRYTTRLVLMDTTLYTPQDTVPAQKRCFAAVAGRMRTRHVTEVLPTPRSPLTRASSVSRVLQGHGGIQSHT